MDRLKRQIAKGMAAGGGEFDTMFKQWGKRYLTDTRKRFVQMSRGGWKPLSPSTLKSRRGGTRRKKTKTAAKK